MYVITVRWLCIYRNDGSVLNGRVALKRRTGGSNSPGVFKRTIKGVVYINYEYDRIYKPDKKYNIPKRTTIGKKCEDDPEMMYPNPNFLTYFPDAELPEDQGRDARSSCLRIGTWIVIEKLMRESLIERIISSLYGDERGTGLFLDLAAYYLTTENNAGQYYPDYAYNHPLFTPEYKIYNDSTVSTFISQISVEDSVSFQNEWNAVKKSRIRYTFLMILPIKTARLATLSSLNSGMPRKIKGFRSSTIPSRMTATTGNRCSTRPTLAASLIYPSCS